MQRLRTVVVNLLVIALLLSSMGGLVWLVYQFFHLLSAVPKDLGAALVAAATTILVATATVMIGRHYERRKELDALYRDKKTEIYDEFLKKFFELFFSLNEAEGAPTEKDLVPFLREFMRKLILWSGPEVIESFVAWKDHLSKGVPDAQSIFLTETFLRAIRSDLRHSNSGLSKGFFARLLLREGDLFLQLASRDPKITLETVAKFEKAKQAESASIDGA